MFSEKYAKISKKIDNEQTQSYILKNTKLLDGFKKQIGILKNSQSPNLEEIKVAEKIVNDFEAHLKEKQEWLKNNQ